MLSLSFITLDPATGRLELLAGNPGPNIVECRLITLTIRDLATGGATTLFLRPAPDPITWMYPRAFIEPGLTVGIYVINGITPSKIVSAEAHYIEFDKRATI